MSNIMVPKEYSVVGAFYLNYLELSVAVLVLLAVVAAYMKNLVVILGYM